MEDDLLVLLLRDTTENHRAERLHEEQQNAALRTEKMATLGTLVAGIAHEINNPNNVITLNAPFLRKIWAEAAPSLKQAQEEGRLTTLAGLPAEEILHEAPDLLDGIERSGERIRRIVQLLKDYVRGTASGEAFHPVQLNEVVATAVELVQVKIRHATLYFEQQLQPDLPEFAGDFQRLEQVVINLLINACEALTSPDKAIRLTTQHNTEKRCIELVIRDEGVGMSEETLRRIGDPFYTTKHGQGGTGLGVSICMSIVQEHGGTIRYASTPGKGTTVTLRLPEGNEA